LNWIEHAENKAVVARMPCPHTLF